MQASTPGIYLYRLKSAMSTEKMVLQKFYIGKMINFPNTDKAKMMGRKFYSAYESGA